MKTNKLLILLSLFMVLLFITSCVEDGDFELPNTNIVDPNINSDHIITFKNVIERAQSGGVFDEDFTTQPIYIEGYVVSSDKAGNFFEEIIIQNKINDETSLEDPRLGLNISVNVRSLSDTYEIGRKVYIKLNGLGVGLSHGVYTIGKVSGNSIGQIQDYEYRDFIIRNPEVVTLTPKVVTINELIEADENTLVQFDDVQIHRSQLGLTFAGEVSDSFDGFRTIESCANATSITLQTSTFADFKSLTLPENRGVIQGVLTRDFGDDLNVLVINSTNDINFDNENRCDPDTLMCDTPSGGGSAFYSEDFESFSDYASEGWTNINVNGGGTDWIVGDFSGNSYAQISGFNSNESEIDVWLVSPTINMDTTTGEELSFDVQTNFDNGNILSVYVSTNFTGDVTTADWTPLDVTIPSGPASGFGSFTAVGPANISCLDGDINIAFFYEGSDPGSTTRYHIDNIEITGNN